MGQHSAPTSARVSAMNGTTSMVAVAVAVTTVIVGVASLVPGTGSSAAEAVEMAPTGTGVLRGIGTGEPLPYVAPEPGEPVAPRQVAGPQPLLVPAADPAAFALPDPLLSTPGSKVIPARVLAAYQAAALAMAKDQPSCHLSWPVLAGIGRIESGHARNGDVDAAGTTLTPIVGPALDGSGHFALIRDSDGGKWDGDSVYDRAVGPMQFLPGTWAGGSGRDGNGDGVANPNNVADAALASGAYLCAGGADLLDRDDLLAAVFRYNRSWEYVSNVLAWAGVYAQTTALGTEAKDKTKGKGKGGKTSAPTPGPAAPTKTVPTPVVTVTPLPSITPTVTPVPTLSPSPTATPEETPTRSPSPEPSEPSTGALGGRVFLDADADGVDDPEEAGVEAASVRLTGTTADGAAVDLTAPTDALGRFAFSGLEPGTYAVHLAELPGGLLPLGVLAGLGDILGLDGVEAVTVTAGGTVVVGFAAGQPA